MEDATRGAGRYSPEEKRALLARLLQEKARAHKTAPLSLAQERLWFMDQLAPGNAAYNMFTALRLAGQLNVEALERSFREVIRRHEILRTTFPSIDGAPMQVIAPSVAFELAVNDLSQLPDAQREQEMRRLAEEEAHRPFQLTRAPLMRAGLLRLAADDCVILVTLHHIISDGWSLDLLTRELSALYAAFSAGESSPLPELSMQFADFARRQRQWFEGGAMDTLLAYWKKQLAGIPLLLELPTDRPRPAVQSYRGASVSSRPDDELWQELKALSRREGVTLFMTLLAAFQVLLHRYSGQNDLNVAVPIAGRQRLEAESLIGFFINSLVMRARLDDDPSFAELLGRTRETLLAADEHQDLPFEKLVEALQPKRSLSYEPLAQACFVFVVMPREEVAVQELQLSSLSTKNATTKYDLTLYVSETETWRSLDMQYNSDLFDQETARRMLAHYETLLRAIVENPHERVSKLRLLTAEERRRTTVVWNDTRTEYPAHVSIQQLFEQQAAQRPEAVALVFGDERVSYAELNRRSNQLAHHLRALGVGPETRVGVLLERSTELVVALLGILKAGGAYVPLDPQYPAARLAFMLEDAKGLALLTQDSLVGKIPASQTRVLSLEAEQATIAKQSTANIRTDVLAENLAYVIYTSGSTGVPKGVAITHRSAVAFIDWVKKTFSVDDLAGVLASTSICFDLSVFELFGTLSVGGKILLAENILHLPTLPAVEQVTLINTVPSALAELVNAGALPRNVRLVNLAGEPIPRRLVEQLYAGETVEHVFNLYGPSEDTTYSTYAVMSKDGINHSNIGRPLSNTQTFILDKYFDCVPVGVSGELYLAGVGLARGYLRRPGLTAERFLPNPFSAEPGTRLYRTGDLARYREDGSIEYLGRADTQVKVRGFRIELGEIETALGEHPAVEQAVVIVRGSGAADKQLTGYVVARHGQAVTPVDLRTFLKEKLPDYMVPHSFALLDELPYTPNGKLDRAALLKLEHAAEVGSYVAPRNALESQLVKIWEELLNLQSIGVTQSFFELGGHSLLAVRLMSRIHKEIGPDLPVSALFAGETVEELARILVQKGDALRNSPLVPIQPRGAGRPFYCVHGIGGNVNNFYHLARHLGREQPFYGLQAPQLHEAEAENLSIEEMAGRYVAAVRDAQAEGPYLLGGYSFGSLVAFEMARQLQAVGQEVPLVVLLDTYSPAVMSRLPQKRDVADQLVTLAWVTSRERGQSLVLSADALREMEFDEQLSFFLEEMRRAGLASPEIDHQLLRRFLKGYEARQQAAIRYTPPRYAGRLTVFRCSERDPLFYRRLEEVGADPHDPALGWGAFSAEPVQVYDVVGNHDAMCNEPYVAGLAERLRSCLAQVAAGEHS